jgi:hypothetical protein
LRKRLARFKKQSEKKAKVVFDEPIEDDDVDMDANVSDFARFVMHTFIHPPSFVFPLPPPPFPPSPLFRPSKLAFQ